MLVTLNFLESWVNTIKRLKCVSEIHSYVVKMIYTVYKTLVL